MTRQEAIENIIAYLEEHTETANRVIEDLDSWNGYLGDDRFYSMEDLNEFMTGLDPIDIIQRAFYGHDGETWTENKYGEKEYGPFNPNRDYFMFNGYGNLVSYDYIDYSDKIDKWLVEELEENRSHVDSIDDYIELSILFDDLEEAE